jgi:hypothetical protein
MSAMATMQQQREHQHQQLQRERDREASFQHTQLGVYLAGAFGLMYLWASSAQVRSSYHLLFFCHDLWHCLGRPMPRSSWLHQHMWVNLVAACCACLDQACCCCRVSWTSTTSAKDGSTCMVSEQICAMH